MTTLDDPPPPCPHDRATSPAELPLPVVGLDDEQALDPALTGGKAAALARVRRAGIPTLPGVVLTTAASDRIDDRTPVSRLPVLAALTEQLGPTDPTGPEATLVVRSSAVAEDQASASAAGQFASVLDVQGPDALQAAVEAVLASRERAGPADQPIAVLIQPLVEPDLAGVAFGVDPVSGRTDRRVVTAVRGRPDVLVSGEAEGSRWVLTPDGTVVEAEERDGAHATRGQLRDLVATAERLAQVLGGPQDVEWALVDGELLVLQSRPVTTVVRGVPTGPVFGPGPVAETFPEPLTPLEEDLWVPPLRDAIGHALRISGTVGERALAGRELLVTVGGRVAMDLEVTGEELARESEGGRGPRSHPKGSKARSDRPRRPTRRTGALNRRIRRLRSAWPMGRLRAALPAIADGLVDQVDTDLDQVPPLGELSSRQLIALVDRGRAALTSLHAHEILMGLVTDVTASPFTGSSVALRVLAEARRDGRTDREILRHAPVVLALVPPRVAAEIALPSDASAAGLAFELPAAPDVQVRREALRLRVRWVQELVGQAAAELGRRLARQEVLADPLQVRYLRLDEMVALVSRQVVIDPPLLAARAQTVEWDARADPLPPRFRISDRGLPIAVTAPGRGGGTGAGGGTARGPVTHDPAHPPEGAVLVVGALTPAIGPQLAHLGGIVAETGSVLSHLAILAREAGVPVVVGHHGARAELPEGTVVSVDGQTGRVTIEGTP